ncbi:aspergillopepsin [Trametes gibbosa]|nr:aspergillopepsin [Trametes gibbosa]
MFSAALFCQVLLATAAFAIPTSRERLARRVARRSVGTHLAHPKISSTTARATNVDSALSNVTDPQYSSSCAGAVLVAQSGTFKSVTGTFTIPNPRKPSGSSGTHSASAWVSIDGDTCGSAVLQTGIDLTVSSGGTSFDAWYEWFPDFAHDFSGISLSAGNSITVTVTATSRTGGTATIVNHSTGQQVSHSFSGQPALCQKNAEWIVEDLAERSLGLAPLASLGSFTFTNASAATGNGPDTFTPSDAIIIDLKRDGRVLSDVSTSNSSVTITYIGP